MNSGSGFSSRPGWQARLVATSARNFAEGGTRDYIKATNSFTGLRRIEMKILRLLRKKEVLF
jgi:hypothetical protein